MRRKNREVTDKQDILDILRRCDTVRIGLTGNDGPYVVPVSFGLDLSGEKPVVYFHCARKGMKVDMLDVDGRVCVEGDIFLGYEVEAHGITTRYESVIGFGKCKVVEGDKEILEGLRLICEHCGFDNVPLDTCWGLSAVRIYRIELDSITATMCRLTPAGGSPPYASTELNLTASPGSAICQVESNRVRSPARAAAERYQTSSL